MPRIVLLSDTHSLHKKLSVPPGDILVHAGDATRTGTYSEIRAFGKWFRSQPHPVKIFVAGNHDTGFQKAPGSARRALGDGQDGLVYLRDSSVSVSGISFWGSPWQPSFNDWAFNLPRDGPELAQRWGLIPPQTDVLITHCPPWGILDMANNEHLGCKSLSTRLSSLRLRLHAFGHIHESAGLLDRDGTRFVNASICDGDYQPVNAIHSFDISGPPNNSID